LQLLCTASDKFINISAQEKSKVLLPHPMKLNMMLYRKAAQAAGWSPLTQVPFGYQKHHVTAWDENLGY